MRARPSPRAGSPLPRLWLLAACLLCLGGAARAQDWGWDSRGWSPETHPVPQREVPDRRSRDWGAVRGCERGREMPGHEVPGYAYAPPYYPPPYYGYAPFDRPVPWRGRDERRRQDARGYPPRVEGDRDRFAPEVRRRERADSARPSPPPPQPSPRRRTPDEMADAWQRLDAERPGGR